MKNDLDKQTNLDAGLNADCVIKLDDVLINIEDNNTNKVSRNLEYMFRLYKSDNKSKRNYTYPKFIIQINLNNFELLESDDIIEEYRITNFKNCLVPIVCYQIYLPKIIKMLYTGHRETMSELQRYLAAMYTDRLDMAYYAAEGFSIMVDYVKEAKIVTEEDIKYFRAYDYEAVDRELMRKDALKEGRAEGRSQERQNTLNAIKQLLKNNSDKESIIKIFNLTKKEIQQLNL